MNTRLTKIILSAITALTIVACGGSGVGIGLSGIGGSGFIASGSISGFGSVFVNGVEYETDSATFDIDGNLDGIESNLAIGMIVQVSGSINDDGITGTATSISFDEELQGPVSTVGAPDADGIKRSLTILGLTVIIDSSSTTFDNDNDNITSSSIVFDFDTIAVNNNVEVSGFFDTNGDLQATRIELKDITFDTNSVIEVEGKITGLSGTTFSLDNFGSLIINAATTSLDDLPNGLEDGQLVEVKGNLDTGVTTLTATRVEGRDNSAEDTDEFELEGIITDYVDDSNFKIGGITVDAGNPDVTREPSSLVLENDAHVEVEGAVVNGVLIATEVESEDGDLKVHATVTSVDLSTNTFTIEPVAGQPITITVTSDTQLQSDVSETKPYTLTDLDVDLGFAEVRGFDDGNGGITAVEVDLKEESDVVLQGFATAATGDAISGGTITILNVTFNFDGFTDFEDESDTNLDNSQIDALISAISSEPQLIKIEDKLATDEVNPAGTADEIDIE